MGLGSPTPFVNAFDHPQINSIRYNTAQNGSPIPIVYGTQRVNVNVIDAYGFNAASAKGGKGGGGGGGGSGGKKGGNKQYSVNIDFAICQGPISFSGAASGIGGQNLVWSNGGVKTAAAIGANLYTGADGQAADPTFAANRGVPVPGYSGTAHATVTPMQMGSTPAIAQIQFQVTGFFAGTAGSLVPDDALPSLIVPDLLSNPRYGSGFPSSNISDLTDFGKYCRSRRLGMSLIMDRQQQSARWIEEIAQLSVAAIFFSGSALRLVPYAEIGIDDNGAAWAPSLTPIYRLTDDDYIDAPSSDPAAVTLTDPATRTNWLSLEYMPMSATDVTQGYNPQMVYTWDQSAIDTYGVRSEASIQAHEFTHPEGAQAAANMMLLRKQGIRKAPITFRLPIKYCLIEPMDVLLLNDDYLGWLDFPARVTSIAEDDNGELTVECEELSGAIPAPAAVQMGNATTVIPSTAHPGGTNTPVIFEPPFALSGGATEVWVVATGEPPNWGGCLVWVSLDGATYENVGSILLGGRQGVLTATFPSGSDPDTTHTLSVDLTECQGQLLSADASEADAFVTLCYVDGELISYQTATLTSAYNYNIGTRIRRGAYASPITSHDIDSQFARVSTTDRTVFRYAYPPSFAGSTVYIKLTSFNLLGLEVEDVATVEPFAYVLSGTGIQPAEFLIAGAFSGRPTASQVFSYVFVGPRSLPLNLAASHGAAGIAATGSTVFAIAKNGTNFGTMTFAAAGTSATFAASAQSFIAGDMLTVTAPASRDATLANVAWTLKGL